MATAAQDRVLKVESLITEMEKLMAAIDGLSDATASYAQAKGAFTSVLYYLRLSMGETLVDGLKAGDVTFPEKVP